MHQLVMIIATLIGLLIAVCAGEFQQQQQQLQNYGGNLAGAVQAGSKYFQYAHTPSKDHYEAGHKRGNAHHFIERHEVAHPHEGHFKTKVRWGDKKGGYGEHYYDYNHGDDHGHYDDDGDETQLSEQYVARPKREKHYNHHQQQQQRADDADVEFINEAGKQRILSGVSARHGGNYRRPERRNRRYDDTSYFTF